MTEYTLNPIGNPNPTEETAVAEVEVAAPIKAELVAQLERAAVDVQVATAHAYPRDRQKALQAIVSEALQDGESMIYTLRYKDNRTGEVRLVQGASIRLAEVVVQNWGNIRVWATVVESRPEYVRARGSAWDMQTNAWATEEVVVPTIDRRGNPYPDRLRIIYQQVAVSKAFRNVVLRLVPRSVVNAAITAIKRQQVVTPKAIAAIRDWLRSIKVTEANACRVVGAPSLDAITSEQLATLRGIYAAIRDGEITVEDAFGLDEPSPAQAPSAAPNVSKETASSAAAATPQADSVAGPTEQAQATGTRPEPKPLTTRAEKIEKLFAEAQAAGLDRASVIEVAKLIGWGADPARWKEELLDPIVSNLEAAIPEMKNMLANIRRRKAAASPSRTPAEVATPRQAAEGPGPVKQEANKGEIAPAEQPPGATPNKGSMPTGGGSTLIDDLLV